MSSLNRKVMFYSIAVIAVISHVIEVLKVAVGALAFAIGRIAAYVSLLRSFELVHCVYTLTTCN